MARGAGLEDFAHLEHAYSPPYAPALDPLAVAAFVAMNQEDGVAARPPDGELAGKTIIDVRHAEEREKRPAPAGALFAETREEILRLAGGVADGAPVVIICERGARSAEAACFLQGRGIRAEYLGGGLRWRALMGMSSVTG
jgi:rhodanese-related sulfurtransferase